MSFLLSPDAKRISLKTPLIESRSRINHDIRYDHAKCFVTSDLAGGSASFSHRFSPHEKLDNRSASLVVMSNHKVSHILTHD